MKLRRYLAKKYKIDDGVIPGSVIDDFAFQVGVSRYAVRKWLALERLPRPETMVIIKQVTRGAVTSRDWIGV